MRTNLARLPATVTPTRVVVGLVGLVLALGSALSPQLAGAQAAPTPTATPQQTVMPPIDPPGEFTPVRPVFSNDGLALAVFSGGFVGDLEWNAWYAGASGVWVQDVTGRFQLLIARGPIFVNDQFAGAFPPASAGAPNFARMVAVTLVK